MSVRKIKRRALNRMGRHPRCLYSKREVYKGRVQRVVLHFVPLTYWKTL